MGKGVLLSTLLVSSLVLVPGCMDTSLPEGYKEVPARVDDEGVITVPQLGIRGQWYAYGDNLGASLSCTTIGKHDETKCSSFAWPMGLEHPQVGLSPNSEGDICVVVNLPRLVPCCTETTEDCEGENTLNCIPDDDYDFSNLWGAGIGFDFDIDIEEGMRDSIQVENRRPWHASRHDVVGMSFTLTFDAEDKRTEDQDPDGSEAIPMRVEFPMRIEGQEKVYLPPFHGTVRLEEGKVLEVPGGEELEQPFSTEEHSYGSPYWRERDFSEDQWPDSDVQAGRNEVFFDRHVYPPPVKTKYNYLSWGDPISGDNLLGVQFHIVPDTSGDKGSDFQFSFCIGDVKFLTR